MELGEQKVTLKTLEHPKDQRRGSVSNRRPLVKKRGFLRVIIGCNTFNTNMLEARVGIGRLDRRFGAKMAHFLSLLKHNSPLLAPTSAD